MTAQVVFLNTNFRPDEDEEKYLEEMQEYLTFCHVRFEYETKALNPHIQKARKAEVHKRARSRLGLVRETYPPEDGE